MADSDGLLSKEKIGPIGSELHYFELTSDPYKNYGFGFINADASDNFFISCSMWYESNGNHPNTATRPIGGTTTTYVKANQTGSYSNPGTPQRFGVAINNKKLVLYYLVTISNMNYSVTFNHGTTLENNIAVIDRFKIALSRYNIVDSAHPNMGEVTLYIHPSTWMKSNLGYLPLSSMIISEDIDNLKQY